MRLVLGTSLEHDATKLRKSTEIIQLKEKALRRETCGVLQPCGGCGARHVYGDDAERIIPKQRRAPRAKEPTV